MDLMLHTILYIKTTSSINFKSNGPNNSITTKNYAPLIRLCVKKKKTTNAKPFPLLLLQGLFDLIFDKYKTIYIIILNVNKVALKKEESTRQVEH
jgi:hypothetical protein